MKSAYQKKAHRLWKNAEWITGDGKYALLAHCRCLTITLWDRQDDAEKSKQEIDRTGCGGRCYGAHGIINLDEYRTTLWD